MYVAEWRWPCEAKDKKTARHDNAVEVLEKYCNIEAISLISVCTVVVACLEKGENIKQVVWSTLPIKKKIIYYL